MRRYVLGLACVMAILAGCTEAPRQTVELSNTVGRDLLEVQRAHRELAVRYFDRIKADINSFVDTKYRPFIIQYTLNDPQLGFMAEFQAAIKPGAKPDVVAFMVDYTDGVLGQVESFRSEMLAPIVKQERKLLLDLDDTYQRLNAANATVTAYLASVVKVSDAQNELLATLGAPNLRQQFVDGAVTFSDQIAGFITTGRQIDTGIATTASGIRDVQKQFGDVVANIKAAADSLDKR